MADERVRMSLEEVQKTEEYAKLTGKQQMFIDTYVAGGLLNGHYDSIEAALTAYACKTREVARIMSYSVMQNIRIIAVLNRHFNKAPIAEFIALIDKAINNKHVSMAQVMALRLKCEVMGYANRLPTDKAPSGVIPKDVIEAEEAHRKATRKPREPKKSKPWQL
jgi:hypothetical protein